MMVLLAGVMVLLLPTLASLSDPPPEQTLHKRHYPHGHSVWVKGFSKAYPEAAETDPFYPAVVSCRFFCPRPDFYLYSPKHWYYCCLPRTTGATHLQCPAQSQLCRAGHVTSDVTAVLTCRYDSQCPSPRDRCCYDVCLRRNVCKRAASFPPYLPAW